MISTSVLGALRVAATLTHGLPGLRCRVRADGRALVEVGGADAPAWPTSGQEHDHAVACSPCGFRAAVADAHLRHGQGERLQLLDLPTDTQPAIDIGTPPGGAARPGGMYRVPLGGRWLWAFATTLDAETVHECCQQLLDEARFEIDVEMVGVRWDPATEVALVYAETTAPPGSLREADVIDLTEACLARVTAMELMLSVRTLTQADGDAGAGSGAASEAESSSGERGA